MQSFFDIRKRTADFYRRCLADGTAEEYVGVCRICCNEKSTKKLHCGHSLCKFCIGNLIESRNDFYPLTLKCPFENCLNSLE